MENRELNTEQQVWQRVFARQEEAKGTELRGLLMAAMELAAGYRYLTGVLTGKPRERVKALYEGELANLGALKGVAMLSGGGEEVLKIWSPSREPVKKLLEKSYHRTRRCMVEYLSRSAESEFGVVFRALADREGTHCVILAELLGSLK